MCCKGVCVGLQTSSGIHTDSRQLLPPFLMFLLQTELSVMMNVCMSITIIL